MVYLFIFLKILSIYLRETTRVEGIKGKGEREPQADFSLSVEPDAGLNPRTLRS